MKLFNFVLFGLLISLLSACGAATTPATSEDAQFVGIVSTNLTLNGQRLNLSNASVTQDGDAATSSVVQPGVELEAQGRSSSNGFEASRVDAKTCVGGRCNG